MGTEDYWTSREAAGQDRVQAVCRVRELKSDAGHALHRATDPDRDVRAGNIDGLLGELDISDPERLSMLEQGARIALNNTFNVQDSITPHPISDIGEVMQELERIVDLDPKH